VRAGRTGSIGESPGSLQILPRNFPHQAQRKPGNLDPIKIREWAEFFDSLTIDARSSKRTLIDQANPVIETMQLRMAAPNPPVRENDIVTRPATQAAGEALQWHLPGQLPF